MRRADIIHLIIVLTDVAVFYRFWKIVSRRKIGGACAGTPPPPDPLVIRMKCYNFSEKKLKGFQSYQNYLCALSFQL